ncbi:hypothetical protein OSB04_015991 [Centaurea solstitialis]|uniref:Uncharacterized protein n=1 Tax=Centaurea solstitialis TaxID=347529 RepID=A0AA38WKM4_9ASTR|nr:hypothetical protein OSB04_015991 [Centaurea solstitialis]
MDLWSWISDLPTSDQWSPTDPTSELTFPLTTPTPKNDHSLEFKARRKFSSNSDLLAITFYVSYQEKPLWVSDTCQLHTHNTTNTFLPLVLQLLQETISRSPTAHDSISATCPRSNLQKLKPDPVSWILDTHSSESFSTFFNLVFLARLFWLCACDAPSEVGALYFKSILAPNLGGFSGDHSPVLRAFFVSAGVDVELAIMRTFGYMLTKWLMLREVGVGLQMLTPSCNLGRWFSYAAETHGLWVLKGYAPVMATTRCHAHTVVGGNGSPVFEAKESVLKYALAHQQVEAVIQFEYSVEVKEGFILVNARVDNIRIHVAKLGFGKGNEGNGYMHERHFPSRVRVWVGPEVGASYVTGLTLGRSTDNVEKETETQKTLKGSFGNTKVPKMKTMTRTTTRTKARAWRWDQDSEGNMAIFDSTLCDNTTGVEIATWQPSCGDDVVGGGGRGNRDEVAQGFQKRYTGVNRSFTKSGNWVLGEGLEGVKWRLNKEMEGSVLKWRIGGQIWLSYFPNEVKSSYFETRCVEWCDEVDLPLILGAY